tara:strand:+ start:141 stop:281 length:141 start_codon:yes stop_codon:yes gene_type:complete
MKKRISYANQVGTSVGSGKPHRSIKKARMRKALRTPPRPGGGGKRP